MMMDWFKRKRPTTLLGLAFDGQRLEAVVAHRTNGSVELGARCNATLVADLRTAEAEVIGRELRNTLDAAGIRERHCTVALSADLALTLQTMLPELSVEDSQSLLQLEAENGFPYSFETLAIATSSFRVAGGPTGVTQLAIQHDYLSRLESILRAARLLPVSFTFGITALQVPASETPVGTVAFWVGDRKVGLLLTSGGGVVALRSLESRSSTDGAVVETAGVPAELVLRELRVSLGQLPEHVRDSLKGVRIFGAGAPAELLATMLKDRALALGLKVERVTHFSVRELGVNLPESAPVSPAVAVVVRQLAERTAGLEFLPPRVSTWQQFAGKYSSGKLVLAGQVTAGIVILVGIAFLWQQWQLIRLRSQWADMSPKVRELEHFQQQIKRFRPWYDESVRSLSILRRLTEAFPENGDVTAKTVELRDPGTVICTGTASDNTALLKALDRLRAMSEVVDVQVDQVRGKAPLQFTFNFQWDGTPRQP